MMAKKESLILITNIQASVHGSTFLLLLHFLSMLVQRFLLQHPLPCPPAAMLSAQHLKLKK